MKNKYFEELKEEGFLDEDEETDPELMKIAPEEDAKAMPRVVKGVLILIAGLFILEILITFFFVGGIFPSWTRLKWTCLSGFLLGSALAVFLFFFMKKQVEEITELEEKQANARIRLGAVARIVLVIAVLAGAFLTGAANPIAVILGILNLKAAALLQPLLDKALKK